MTIEEKKNRKRKSILDAAYALFTANSFSSTAIDDVVKRAGIAKGTFYLYFRDKYDLLDQIIAYRSTLALKDAWHRLLEERESRDMISLEQVTFYISCLIDYMERNRELLAVISKNLSMTMKIFSCVEDEEIRQAVNEMIALFMREGHGRSEATSMLYIVADMVASVCCDAILYKRPGPIDEVRPALFLTLKKILA